MSNDQAQDGSGRVAGNGRSEIDKAKLTVPRTLLIFLLLGLGSLWFLSMTLHITLWAAVFWGLAMYATGVLGGFVFGIPRVLDREAEASPPRAQSDAKNADGSAERLRAAGTNGSAAQRRRSSINSNLVEVSDWLTKIIVGVGLVELKALPGHGKSLAEFIARSVMPIAQSAEPVLFDAAVSLSGAIALYFGVLGFITGYLLTRIFLAVIMSLADRDVDAVDAPMELPGGQRLPLQDLLEGFRASIADVQSKVANLFNPSSVPAATTAASAPQSTEATAAAAVAGDGVAGSPAAAQARPEAATPDAASSGPPAGDSGTATPASDGSGGAAAAATAPAASARRVKRILWVDDSPNRNALLAARLRQAGIIVDQVTTTSEALQRLSREEYSVVITDIVRQTEDEPGSAGLRLIKDVRMRFPAPAPTAASQDHLPVLVFCGRASEARASQEAIASGADLITSSHVDLLGYLTKYLGLV